jgi:hypothetical protein
MPTPTKPPRRIPRYSVSVYLAHDVVSAVERAARKAGLSRSAWIARVVAEAAGVRA